MKPTLISGIQPSGALHLGNYLGALKNFVDLQNSGEYDCYFFIADYHSITEDFNPSEKTEQILNLAATYLAAGLDPKKSTLFIQSAVPASTELAWIFSALAPFGELRRMTQFKEKAGLKDSTDLSGIDTNIGLLTYPLLMTADIALYDARLVPVGDDQLQHLELARTLIRRFNSRFGPTFIEPKEIITSVPRLMSLDDPTKKMSKSRPAGCLFIDDHPAEIEAKLRHAVTDSENAIKYDPIKKAGISNLLLIMNALSGKSMKELETAFAGQNYSELKHAVSDVVADYFQDFRAKKSKLLEKPAGVLKAFASGNKKASKIAEAKMAAVRKLLGLSL